MDGAFDVAVEHSGDLVCATNHAVIRIDRASGAFHALTRGALSGARSLAVAADGSVLVVDTDDGQIIRVNPGTGAPRPRRSRQLAGTPGRPDRHRAERDGPDGRIRAMAGVSFAVLVRIDLAGGHVNRDVPEAGVQVRRAGRRPERVVFVVALDLSGNKSMLIRFSPATGQQTVVFNRPDVLLNRVALTPRGEPLLTGTAVPGTTPSRGVLLRLDPGNVTAGNWAAHEFSAGGRLRMQQGLGRGTPGVRLGDQGGGSLMDRKHAGGGSSVMTFHVYPDPADFRLFLRAATTSPPIPLAEPTAPGGGELQTIFVRCAVSGWDGAPPARGGPGRAAGGRRGGGDQVTSVNGVNPTPVAGGRAFATVFPSGPAGRGVFLVRMFKNTPDPRSAGRSGSATRCRPGRLRWRLCGRSRTTPQGRAAVDRGAVAVPVGRPGRAGPWPGRCGREPRHRAAHDHRPGRHDAGARAVGGGGTPAGTARRQR